MKENEFKTKCEKARELKVIIKNAEKEFTPLRKELSNYANQNGLEGEHHGIKFQQRHSFNLEENVKLAKENEIAIPVILRLNLTQERITDLIKQGIFKEHEIEETVNDKQLREILEMKGLDVYFTRSIAILL